MFKSSCCGITLNQAFFVAVLGGLLFGFLDLPLVHAGSYAISEVFIHLLKMVSVPLIFLSLLSTASGMEDAQQFKWMGLRVIRYTVLTTVLSAAIALGMFLAVDPVRGVQRVTLAEEVAIDKTSYLEYLLKAVPSNMLKPFVENHVIGVMMIALLLSLAVLSLPREQRAGLHVMFHGLFSMIMKITGWLVKAMPIAVFAFLVLFVQEMKHGMEASSIAYYLFCVLASNMIQGVVILPLLLFAKGISPVKFFSQMLPALSVAFFSKSSSATIPMAIKCSTERAHVSSRTAHFALPLCTTINMNGCAAFILTTVLFVTQSEGMQWSLVEMFGWVIIASIAALGNAGVPMGCYFLSSAILASMNVPLSLLGVILPFYTLIDMVETALNVWSDACVTIVVEKESKQQVLT
jgi:Na+/H+-dicarboxylate symporter